MCSDLVQINVNKFYMFRGIDKIDKISVKMNKNGGRNGNEIKFNSQWGNPLGEYFRRKAWRNEKKDVR